MAAAAVEMSINEELEALEAIFTNTFTVHREEGVPRVVETVVHPFTAQKYDQRYVCLKLEVKLSPDYPESSPEVFIRNPRGLDDAGLSIIDSRIKEKLNCHVGNPILYELVEIVREFLTQRNLPSGQCVICLHGFVTGDVFIKTPCYHHFHSHCMSKHLVSSEKYHKEELDKLPKWQRAQAAAYKQTCPVCRSEIEFDVKTLEEAPPPVESVDAPPFELTDELRAHQQRMAAILERQVARGGVVGSGDDGPPLLTISDAADKEEPSTSANAPKPSTSGVRPTASTSTGGVTQPANQAYRGPYRGFNRRPKPGRRGRGGAR